MSVGAVGAPMPCADTVIEPGDSPASPGGTSKRDSGVMTTAVAVFDPTRNDGTVTAC